MAQPTCARRPGPSRRHALSAGTVAALLALGLAPGVQAQTSPAPQRIEITGSAIKRIDGETALPVQVITREEIVKAGVTTAAEIMATVSASANNLTDGVSISNGGFKDQVGFNSANLRGIGTSSTLVLLNGRRMANFASPGDDSGVDLNNIPAAAIQRVEVLLDGASAIYGTDAIGGVVNFITRKDYQGVELNAYLGTTTEGGASKKTASIAAGTGDVGRDGYNVFGVFDVQQTGALRTSQRQFISDLNIPERLPHLLSSYPQPANIFLTKAQLATAVGNGLTLGGVAPTSTIINMSAPDCSPPHSLNLPGGIGGPNGCTYDFMRDLELYPASQKLGFLGRGVLDLGGGHQAFAELSLSRAQTEYVGTSTRIRLRRSNELPTSMIPGLETYLPGETVEVRARLLEAGNRKTELTSTGQRVVLGLNGTLGAWDYDTALTHGINRVSDRDKHGYLLYEELIQGIQDGTINIFGPSSAAGLAYLDSIQVNDVVRKASGSMTSVDFKASRTLGQLDGGPMSLALGAEFRREQAKSSASDLLLSDNINEDWTPGDSQFTDNARNVWAFYGELAAPLSKTLELQLALRHDQYQRIGGTTNPKLGLRWQPDKAAMFRASFGTGFRAPSMNDLYRPAKWGSTAILPDPVYCSAPLIKGDLGLCADSWDTLTYSNPNLKPERSSQFSLGAVFELGPQWSASIDYWSIKKRDLISTIGDDVILSNLDKYGDLVHRSYDDNCECDSIDNIDLVKENRGRMKASGIDFGLDLRGLRTAVGKFGAHFVGTLALSSKKQTGYGDPYVSNLGKFVTDGVVQRWRHRLTVDWSQGPWAASLSNQYLGSYTDQNSAIDTNTGTVVNPNRVKAYSLWDLSGSWEMSKQTTLRAGVKNLFDTAPPFSNQAYFFISGYDPSYTDPRGRFVYVSGQYKFQ